MITRAEALLASATAALATAILTAYVPFRLGWHIAPSLVLILTAAAFIGCAAALWRIADAARSDALAAAAVFVAIAAWFLWLARPDFLPLGGGPDLAHHLVLINHIQRTWQLVDDPKLYPYLGDMMDYTPGSHLLIALAGASIKADALRAVHPVLTLTVALKSAFVFAIAKRLAPTTNATAAGVAAALTLFLPYEYFAGSFATHSYWPQVVSELFACACWWALIAWLDTQKYGLMLLFGLFSSAVFLTWPIWIGPIVMLACATIAWSRSARWRDSLRPLALGLGPVAIVAAVHSIGRTARLQMAATSGFVIQPSIATLGWPFLLVAAAGLAMASRRRRYATALLFVAAIALQAVVLLVAARARSASTPYMALKMMYLAIYPLAVAASAIVPARSAVAIAAAATTAAAAAYSAAAAPKPSPIVTMSAWQAGLWARDHADRACVDYLVAEGYVGYWLHLAVLDNPRETRRFNDPDTFEPQKAIARWVDVEGLPYAIVDDVNHFSKALFEGSDTVAQFGPSIVIKRRGRSICPEH